MDEEKKSYEQSIYTFDSSTVENGYVELSEHKTMLYFPPLKQALSSVPRELNMYLNNILIFSFKWLPFYSHYDYIRIKDMFHKVQYYLGAYYSPTLNSSYQAYNKLITNINVKHVTIYTHEEPPVFTNIQLSCNAPSPTLSSPPSPSPILLSPVHVFQIKIGSSTVFCSERDLPGLNDDESMYIIGFIIQKITNIL